MIYKIKDELLKKRKKVIKIKVNSGRGKYDFFEGYICDIYDRVWTFYTSSCIKSFTYVDVLLRDVEICS